MRHAGTVQASPSGGNTGSDTLAPAPSSAPAPTPSRGSAEIKGLLDGEAASLGNPTAEIVVIEYSDYQCPFCRRWFNDVKSQLDKDYIETGKVQFIYKDFPLSFHPMAIPYAQAARCAGEQDSSGNYDKYWEYHDKIFEEQQKFGSGTISNLTVDDIKQWAEELGLDTTQFNSCLDSGKYANDVQANFSEGQGVGVSGTPSFIIGKRDGTGQLIVGAQPYSVFKSTIDALLN